MIFLGCGKTLPCKSGTVLVSVELSGATVTADTLTIVVTANGVAGSAHDVAHRTGVAQGAIEIDFPPRVYAPGAQVTVQVTASLGGSVLGAAGGSLQLPPRCGTLSLIIAVSGDGGPDQSVAVDDLGDAGLCSGSDCCTTSPDDCPAGQFCDSGQICRVGCKAGSDCTGMGPATDGGLPRTSCNTTLHQCAECTSNNQCPLGKVCSPAGVCAVGCDGTHACAGGGTCCNSFCVDTTSDPLNCGVCGNPCTGSANACCSSSCVDVTASVDNCSSCGQACSSSEVATRNCVAGACAPICNFGRGDCNSLTVNDGCETDLTAASNCGGCNIACAPVNNHQSSSACHNVLGGGAATCQYTCMAPFVDCDTAAPDTNGCECGSGNYCNGTTCATCNTQTECSKNSGSCVDCSSNASGDACVNPGAAQPCGCTGDSDCAPGNYCEATSQPSCVAKIGNVKSCATANCEVAGCKACAFNGGSMCPASNICPCDIDSDCGMNKQYCTNANVCASPAPSGSPCPMNCSSDDGTDCLQCLKGGNPFNCGSTTPGARCP